MSEDTVTRKERDKLRRENDFLDAAEKLFSERGYFQTSMEDVAKQAEYATGTIYRYFPSKEELYHAILIRKGDAYIKMIQSKLKGVASPTERITIMMHHEVDFWFENAEFMRIYMSEIEKACDPTNPPDGFQDIHKQYTDILSGILNDGIKKGEFRKMNVDMLMLTLLGLVHSLLSNTISPEMKVTKKDVESYIIDFFTNGFIAKGK